MLMRHFDKRKIYSTVQQQLQIIKQVDTLQQIEYDQLLYIVSRKKIPISIIQFYLHKKYSGQSPKQWRQINDSQITKQYQNLKKDYTQNQWRYSNATSPSKFKAKMAKYQKFQSAKIGQSRPAIKNRIKAINDMIVIHLANMNTAKKENQYVAQREKYNELKEELKYWQQKTKKLQQPNMQNSFINKKTFTDNKLQLFDKIQEKLKLKQQKSLQKFRKYQIGETVDRDAQIQRLRKIFDFYTKKNTKQAKLFQDITKIHHKLSLQAYLKFIKEFKLNRILSFQEISKIFKKKADAKRQIDFNKFCQTFESIYTQQCIKLKIQFIPKQFQQYLIHQVFPNSKLRQFLKIVVQKKRAKSIGQNLANRIGQSPQDIIEEYRQKRNLQNQKYKKNRYKNFILKSFQSDRLDTISYDNRQIQRNSNSAILNQTPTSLNKLRYSKKFSKQKGVLSLSSMNNSKLLAGKASQTAHLNDQYQIQQDQKKKTFDAYLQIVRNPQLQQLRQIITQQQEDQYLNKHLLPPINQKDNKLSKIGLNSKKFHF